MATQSRFTINGLIDTSQTALQNLEDICNSCGGWLTFDNYSGKWSVVINQPGSSIKTFDHSNIIGGIRMNGTGLEDLYNAVKVTYPLNDIQNNTDFIEIALPESEWNPNEVKNVLDISLPLVNNQVQARLIGFRDLKQNRVNQIIQFETDYSSIGLKAGDIITVTSAPLGLASALYRISEIREQDSAELGITLTITAILYSAEVYNENNLSQYILTTENGIITAGDIGTPPQPTVTTYQQAARPRLVIDTQVPSGVISAMEFWLAVSSPSAVYTLVGTETNTSGVYLTEGSTVTLDISNQNTGNVYVKTRAINSTTAGAFSPVSALIPFVPVQVTDKIGEDTELDGVDLSGLALPLLLSKLTSLFGPGDGNKSLVDRLIDAGGMDSSTIQSADFGVATTQTQLNAMAAGYTDDDGYDQGTVIANAIPITFNLATPCKLLDITVTTPLCDMQYRFQDRTGTIRQVYPFVAQPPMGIDLLPGTPANPGQSIASTTIDWQFNNVRILMPNIAAGNYFILAYILPTYDLDMYWERNLDVYSKIFFTNFTVTGGQGLKLTLNKLR